MTAIVIGTSLLGPPEIRAQANPTHPVGDDKEVNLIYWYSTKNPDKNFQVRIFDDRPIPDAQKDPWIASRVQQTTLRRTDGNV